MSGVGGKLVVFRDGDQWCAHFDDFVDIQESRVGFGRTIPEALADLSRPELDPCPCNPKHSIEEHRRMIRSGESGLSPSDYKLREPSS